MLIQKDVPLAPLTTLKVGGLAQYFVEAKTIAEVNEAVGFVRSKNLPLFVLGGGSNLVVADAGWSGLVLKSPFPAWRSTKRTAEFATKSALAKNGTAS